MKQSAGLIINLLNSSPKYRLQNILSLTIQLRFEIHTSKSSTLHKSPYSQAYIWDNKRMISRNVCHFGQSNRNPFVHTIDTSLWMLVNIIHFKRDNDLRYEDNLCQKKKKVIPYHDLIKTFCECIGQREKRFHSNYEIKHHRMWNSIKLSYWQSIC